MKRVLKGTIPPKLSDYAHAVPQSSWEQMRNDPHFQGQQAYNDCRTDCITYQKGLCAYCEINIRDNDPLKCHVEHFHEKSDRTTSHNWALDWNNMLGVCNGGSHEFVKSPGFYRQPRSANLSCDAHKNQMVQQGRLPKDCEGWILNPLQLTAFPSLFQLKKNTGELKPDPIACGQVSWPGNQHTSVEALVQNTIKMLNLNCDRLAQERRLIIWDIEHNKKRQRAKGFDSNQGLSNLAQRYLQVQWPAYFTVIRCCLGQAAEQYLHSIGFEG